MNGTENVIHIWDTALKAVGGDQRKLTPQHLLYGCTMVNGCKASDYLTSCGITPGKVTNTSSGFMPDMTALEVMDLAALQSGRFDHPVIVSEALLYVLCTKCKQTKSVLEKLRPGLPKRLAAQILRDAGVSDENDSLAHLKLNAVRWDTTDTRSAAKNVTRRAESTIAQQLTPTQPSTPAAALPEALLNYGQDLTAKACQGKIDAIIGRDEETNRLIEILCRKTKNNPVLIGEAGVGKSAIIEGFAQRVVDGNVPDLLQNKIVFSLDIGLLLGGSKYRGELEGRLNKVLQELSGRDDIILFIDELHNIVTSGNSEGELSVGEILKPALARGNLRCVGATTIDEYRKYIEKDPALERRFAPITVYPPTPEQTIQILDGLVPGFERFHKVQINHSAVLAAVQLSNRYIFDRNLPDKAIDVLDEACAKAKVQAGATTAVITAENIAAVVAAMTKIPLTKINQHDKESLLNFEKELQSAVIGQDKAIAVIANTIRRNRSGITDANRPIGSFFFLGRTGVGKTEVCKQLAQRLFDTEKAFIKLDMSEFSESHSVSKLVGAPPGYVGYDDGSALCNRVKRNPYCLVLFDEIEKAHHDIYNLLLQILDEGRLTDAHGKVVSFKNALIVLTSNVGVSNLPAGKILPPAEEEQIILSGMRQKFSPEFINRLDNIVVFNTLTPANILAIVKLQLDKLTKKLRDVNLEFSYSDAVPTYIAKNAYQPEYGVRPLRRFIQTRIEDKISELIITGNVFYVTADIVNDQIVVQSNRL